MIDTLPFMMGKRIRIHYNETDGMIDLVQIIDNEETVLSSATREQIVATPIELATILFKYAGVRPEEVSFDFAERTKDGAVDTLNPKIKKPKKVVSEAPAASPKPKRRAKKKRGLFGRKKA